MEDAGSIVRVQEVEARLMIDVAALAAAGLEHADAHRNGELLAVDEDAEVDVMMVGHAKLRQTVEARHLLPLTARCGVAFRPIRRADQSADDELDRRRRGRGNVHRLDGRGLGGRLRKRRNTRAAGVAARDGKRDCNTRRGHHGFQGRMTRHAVDLPTEK